MTAAANTHTSQVRAEHTNLPSQRAGAQTPPACIQRACACGAAAGISGECSNCTAEKRLGLQAKLGISPPDDYWEREADRVADQVVSERPRALERPLSVTPLVQRQVVEEEEDDEEEIQAQSSTSPLIPRKAHKATAASEAATALNSGGRPLSSVERTYFEPRFGRDLSAVRLHDDSRAGAAAQGIGARAYTLGSRIAFAPGEYAPQTASGLHLIAHELTHTLQQGPTAASLQRAESGGTFGGFFRNIALFFGARVSESEQEAYLNQVEELGGPALDYDSDNKALAIANRIQAEDGLFGHDDTVELRKILILDMQDGATFGDEEESILFLIMSLPDHAPVVQLFEGSNALNPEALRSDIDGDNRLRLDSILSAHGIAAEGLESGPNYGACQPEERTAIEDAVRLSQRDITQAIEHLESAPESQAVRNSFFLAFRIENPSAEDINTMIFRLNAVREGAHNVPYICDHGEEETSRCREENIGGHTSNAPSRSSVSICFMPETGSNTENLTRETDRDKKSMLITHEAAHFYLRTADQGYFTTSQCKEREGTDDKPGTSSLTSEERFDNADSYSCFVFYLTRISDQEPDENGENETLAERAEAFRGGNLGIQVEYPDPLIIPQPNFIYIEEPERTELFVVTGSPPESGFSYNWVIEVGSEVLPLTADEVWGRPIKHIAYVPEETKERLRSLHSAGETEAEVVLNTTPYPEAPESATVERRFRVRLVTGEAEGI